jgi:glycosyltransferase involved in cell wall biosynthesis
MEPKNLANIMAAATALTFVPYFEGFGIPVIEAMASKTAVITSNKTAMPEVADNAALLVDPFDTNSIVNAMQKVAFDDKLRGELEVKGLERAKAFSWDKTAEKLWNCIEKAINA